MADDKTTTSTSTAKKAEDEKKNTTSSTATKAESKPADKPEVEKTQEEKATEAVVGEPSTPTHDDPVKAYNEGRTFNTTGL